MVKVQEILRTGVKVIEPATGEARTAFRRLDGLFVEGADFGVAALQQFSHAVITTFGGEAHLEGRSSVPIRNNKTDQVFVFSTRDRFPDPRMTVTADGVSQTISTGADGSFTAHYQITREETFRSPLTGKKMKIPARTVPFGPQPVEGKEVKEACSRLYDLLLTAL